MQIQKLAAKYSTFAPTIRRTTFSARTEPSFPNKISSASGGTNSTAAELLSSTELTQPYTMPPIVYPIKETSQVSVTTTKVHEDLPTLEAVDLVAKDTQVQVDLVGQVDQDTPDPVDQDIPALGLKDHLQTTLEAQGHRVRRLTTPVQALQTTRAALLPTQLAVDHPTQEVPDTPALRDRLAILPVHRHLTPVAHHKAQLTVETLAHRPAFQAQDLMRVMIHQDQTTQAKAAKVKVTHQENPMDQASHQEATEDPSNQTESICHQEIKLNLVL